ncbi:uncharacterized protein PODANS_2_7600 [Podospora anserina S mat+]|uniref:Podospora anserina S mat+ genomic DNA chromosome 2, supercontig 2 n=1 Tax=Podospora anserina (strain S / ATCC MYA-4624 / DSM 980 / FGSC 10383) TaxID=515849 RepID=B2B6F1_PODAN|nr:uncharacterized protein PODANS_2_7600 [Podospora anserina S mat+]CAP73376.1 unnamed protein product [Podospora anserina S mat+]CDP25779.1 Putative protein of unknown function [Podospora anserina S mat+]
MRAPDSTTTLWFILLSTFAVAQDTTATPRLTGLPTLAPSDRCAAYFQNELQASYPTQPAAIAEIVSSNSLDHDHVFVTGDPKLQPTNAHSDRRVVCSGVVAFPTKIAGAIPQRSTSILQEFAIWQKDVSSWVDANKESVKAFATSCSGEGETGVAGNALMMVATDVDACLTAAAVGLGPTDGSNGVGGPAATTSTAGGPRETGAAAVGALMGIGVGLMGML